MKIWKSQKELMKGMRILSDSEIGNTKSIRERLGFEHQGYETHLRDRLFRLAEKGILDYREIPNKYGCRERIWRWTSDGHEILDSL